MDEIYTIVHKVSQHHYNTYEEAFYCERWERMFDSREHLEHLMDNYPDKFEGCEIEINDRLISCEINEKISEIIEDNCESGDISPSQTLQLEELTNKLAELIAEIVTQNQ